jgi:MFS family permease
MGFWFFMTQFLQEVMGFRPLTAGFAFLPTTITSFISALYIPKLTKKFGNINVLVIGIATTLIGMVFLSRISVDSSYFPGIALPMILFGIGQGMSIGPLTAAAIVGVHSKDAGAASGMVNVAHQLGCSLGLSILIVIFAHAGTEILEPRASLAHKVSSVLTASSIILMFTFALVCKLALKHSPILANSEKSD